MTPGDRQECEPGSLEGSVLAVAKCHRATGKAGRQCWSIKQADHIRLSEYYFQIK